MAIQATKLAANLQQEGFHVIPIATNPRFDGIIGLIDKLRFVRTFARTLSLLHRVQSECKNVDVFYFLTGFFGFFFWVTLPVLVLLKLKKKRIILSARGGDAGRFFARWKLIVKPILKIPKIVTVPSSFLQKAFSEHLQMPTVLVPNIADIDQFHFRKREQLHPKFIVTRHLEPIYNIAGVVHAFSIISRSIPESILTIVGDGSQKEELKQLVHSLGLSCKVVFQGRVLHEQLPSLYNAHDILINASNVDNMPGAILEAFACGLPVVSTRAGGIPYLVEHEKTGLLVELNDHEALAASAIRLLGSALFAQSIAQNAFLYVQGFSWSKIKEILVPILDSEAVV